ncbi:hypothetical protein CYMTET_9689 [Cymbomonas tetramitiformis]|uniref:Uncharacterized protein n=1 Tax=Cymbomonas tetramitiformis TaxID=36881 RepID=A0AAE0GQM0_9CHLO|nr:hypothetical protein CYMTET_9689 [Cymbomonas tetramitiformis]
MDNFRKGNIAESIEYFDEVLEMSPKQKPFLWQRGLSLYYANRFVEGAEQFRSDVAVNPNDTEEAIWAFMCEARLDGPEQAQQGMLKVGQDFRPVMRAAYEAFSGEGTVQQLEAAAGRDRGGHDRFYSYLYIGLWYEAHNDEEAAREYIQAAAQTPYGQKSGDYMASLAEVHLKQRNWV